MKRGYEYQMDVLDNKHRWEALKRLEHWRTKMVGKEEEPELHELLSLAIDALKGMPVAAREMIAEDLGMVERNLLGDLFIIYHGSNDIQGDGWL